MVGEEHFSVFSEGSSSEMCFFLGGGFCQMRRHISPIVVGRPIKGYLANSADPDQMPENAASDQGLHCFQIV